MKLNKLYRTELQAARRAAEWIDRHPYVSNAFLATVSLIFAYYVFMYYPI